MSWFSSTPSIPLGPNIHTPQERFKSELLFGKLLKEDTEWLCAGGFITETQTFYATTLTGGIIMCQVIHSSLGLVYFFLLTLFFYYFFLASLFFFALFFMFCETELFLCLITIDYSGKGIATDMLTLLVS